MNINLHIERLVLDNVCIKTHQKRELKAAVESELQQKIGSQGLGFTMQSTINRQAVKCSSIPVENRHKPIIFGQKIAEAVYRGIGT